MKPDVNEMAALLLQLTREIISLLDDHAAVAKIIEVTDKRDELITAIEKSNELISDKQILEELLRLKAQEDVALKPYRSEFQDVRQSLINLRHAEAYYSSEE